MILHSRVPPHFFPRGTQTTILEMGLQQLLPSQWMIVDEDSPVFLRHKLEQKQKRPSQIYRALPTSKEAQDEFKYLLEKHLITDHRFHRINAGKLTNPKFDLDLNYSEADLWSTSLWVQEDICLLEEIENKYVLTAASVCSPSNWDLPSKIGKPVSEIHKPVPGYRDQMSDKVDRLMRNLKTDRPVQRLNWSIQPNGDLYWKTGSSDHEKIEQKNYWRVERQTLFRMPETKAIVFGIRVFLHSFSVMSKFEGFNDSIAAIIESLPAEQSAYKNLL